MGLVSWQSCRLQRGYYPIYPSYCIYRIYRIYHISYYPTLPCNGR